GLDAHHGDIFEVGVESSVPGDGTIPVIESSVGGLSPIICYDADHPQLMAQVSKSETDLLVCPTGDWAGIAPLHTYMAAVRCIENGTSMLKATNGGLSALIDSRGTLRHQARLKGNETTLLGTLPVASVNTPYAWSAPIFRGLLNLALLGFIGWMLFATVQGYFGRTKPVVVEPAEVSLS
ncbi:MAG: nitrilase-related carbon-nitrogen hydrolase, partial [Bacteroidota bacterium]